MYTYFDYDDLNSLTAHRTKRNPIGIRMADTAVGPTGIWAKRGQSYDATGRLVKSNYKTWANGQQEPGGVIKPK